MFKKKKNLNEIKESIFDSLPVDYQLVRSSVQDIMPFESIEDSMICLKDNQYRMIVEVSSLNYYLKTHQEQESIEGMFRNALTSWDFPFSFYTQTRNLEADEIERNIQKDIDNCTTSQMKDYGTLFMREMGKINRGKSGVLVKKNYVIVQCDDAKLIEANKTDEDCRSYAFDKLSLNVRKVGEGLSPLGLKCKVLNNHELAELLFIAINKQSAFKANDLLSHMSNIVFPYDEWNATNVQTVFEGFKTQLNNMLARTHSISSGDIVKARQILESIEQIENDFLKVKNEYFDL